MFVSRSGLLCHEPTTWRGDISTLVHIWHDFLAVTGSPPLSPWRRLPQLESTLEVFNLLAIFFLPGVPQFSPPVLWALALSFHFLLLPLAGSLGVSHRNGNFIFLVFSALFCSYLVVSCRSSGYSSLLFWAAEGFDVFLSPFRDLKFLSNKGELRGFSFKNEKKIHLFFTRF